MHFVIGFCGLALLAAAPLIQAFSVNLSQNSDIVSGLKEAVDSFGNYQVVSTKKDTPIDPVADEHPAPHRQNRHHREHPHWWNHHPQHRNHRYHCRHQAPKTVRQFLRTVRHYLDDGATCTPETVDGQEYNNCFFGSLRFREVKIAVRQMYGKLDVFGDVIITSTLQTDNNGFKQEPGLQPKAHDWLLELRQPGSGVRTRVLVFNRL